MKIQFLLLDLDNTEQWMTIHAENFETPKNVLNEIQNEAQRHNFDQRRELSHAIRNGEIPQRLIDAIPNDTQGTIKISMEDRQYKWHQIMTDTSQSSVITFHYPNNQAQNEKLRA